MWVWLRGDCGGGKRPLPELKAVALFMNRWNSKMYDKRDNLAKWRKLNNCGGVVGMLICSEFLNGGEKAMADLAVEYFYLRHVYLNGYGCVWLYVSAHNFLLFLIIMVV